jgi:hypothetical protein
VAVLGSNSRSADPGSCSKIVATGVIYSATRKQQFCPEINDKATHAVSMGGEEGKQLRVSFQAAVNNMPHFFALPTFYHAARRINFSGHNNIRKLRVTRMPVTAAAAPFTASCHRMEARRRNK